MYHYRLVHWKVSFIQGCPLFRVSFIRGSNVLCIIRQFELCKTTHTYHDMLVVVTFSEGERCPSFRVSAVPPPKQNAPFAGGDIVSTFDSPGKVKLGSCKLIEEMMIGEDMLLRFSGVALGEACTIVIRGATQQILDEAERSLHDALCVLQQTVKETRIVYGGGKDPSSQF